MAEAHLKTGGEKPTFTTGTAAPPASFSAYCLEVFEELKIRRKHRFVVYKHVAETGEMEVDALGHRCEPHAWQEAAAPTSSSSHRSNRFFPPRPLTH
jgi:hypothetical protein